MKKLFTLFTAICIYTTVSAQCTTTGFDVCTGPSPIVTSFTIAVQVAGTGTPLTVGARYKFDNIVSGVDGIVRIDKMVNAVMSGTGVTNPSIDDDNAMDDTGV